MKAEILEMTDAEYFAIKDRCSASTIKGAFRKSPAHYKAEQAKYTDSLNFGSIAHKAILEPLDFRNKYIVAPKFDKRTKAGKEAFANFAAIKGDREVITQTDQSDVIAMKAAIESHGMAKRFINSPGAVEQVILFELFGVPFKAKLDKLCPKFNTVIDYKTSKTADANSFKYDYIKYGYHIQGYIYLQAAILAGFDVAKVTFIVQEKTSPFAVNIFNLSEDALILGELETQELAPKWFECYKSDKWPCYPEIITELELPFREQKRIDQLSMNMLEF